MLQIPGLRFWYPSIKFGQEINLNGLCLLLSDWRMKWISLLKSFCKYYNFLMLKQEVLNGDFWEVFCLIFCFPSLGIMTQLLLKSYVGNEIWLKKSTEVSNYGKFICNIFEWDTVKIRIVRAKAKFSVCI